MPEKHFPRQFDSELSAVSTRVMETWGAGGVADSTGDLCAVAIQREVANQVTATEAR
jgi:hypothetical protein